MSTPSNIKLPTNSPSVIPASELPAWKALKAHHSELRKLHLRDLFRSDPNRVERFTAEAAGIYLDYSKNRITTETIALLLQLAEQSGLRARIDAMFNGDRINITEDRAVLHVALRAPQRRVHRWWTGGTSCRRFTPSSTR